MVAVFIVAVIAYLIGSISSSVIISKKFAGFDVREKGSGNAGTTNVLRTVGKKAALITLICDVLKGVIAIGVALLVGSNFPEVNRALLVQVAGILVVIGHTFPIFFKFKGGKGVATSLGVLLMTNWQVGLICLVFAIMLMAVTKMVSLGSISAAVLFATLALFTSGDRYIVEGNYVVFAIILAFIVIFNHRSNLKRISEGTENKLDFEKLFKNAVEERKEAKRRAEEEKAEKERLEKERLEREKEEKEREEKERAEREKEERERREKERAEREKAEKEREEQEKAQREQEEKERQEREEAEKEAEENDEAEETEEVSEESVEENNDEENETAEETTADNTENDEAPAENVEDMIDDVIIKNNEKTQNDSENPPVENSEEVYNTEDEDTFFDGKKRKKIRRRFTTKEDRKAIEKMVREAEEKRKKSSGENQ